MIEAKEPEVPFSKFPQEIDDFFGRNEVKIALIPSEFIDRIREPLFPDLIVSTAIQYLEFLEAEEEFWNKNRFPTLDIFWNTKGFYTAKTSFLVAVKYFEARNSIEGAKALSSSVNTVKSCLYSKTSLACLVLNFREREQGFFRGLRIGFLKKRPPGPSLSLTELDGFYTAIAYRERTNPLFREEVLAHFAGLAESQSEKLSALSRKYTASFHEQEVRLAEITKQSNLQIQNLQTDSEKYWKENNNRREQLENLYSEKLKLEAPATYWEEMAKQYSRKGTTWLWVSTGLAAGILAGLIKLFFSIQDPVDGQIQWVGLIRSYTLITAIAGIGFYMLRLTVRMTMSSYHQSRDAEERNKLSYFYLALTEKGAVSEKERALVINALFSRSETGLLKGDATPSMAQNVTDLVNAVSKK
ncbi:MAG: hypothetical protein IJN19_04970 [Opitutales bacterium]|nr:hypothetical protein [Opitutales bacterium]